MKRLKLLFIAVLLAFSTPIQTHANENIILSIPVEEIKDFNTDNVNNVYEVLDKEKEDIKEYLSFVNERSEKYKYFIYLYDTEINKEEIIENIKTNKDFKIIFLNLETKEGKCFDSTTGKERSIKNSTLCIDDLNAENYKSAFEKMLYFESGISVYNDEISTHFVTDTTNTLEIPENIEEIAFEYSLKNNKEYHFIFVDDAHEYLGDFVLNDTLNKDGVYYVITTSGHIAGGYGNLRGKTSPFVYLSHTELENIKNKNFSTMLENFYLNDTFNEFEAENIEKIDTTVNNVLNMLVTALKTCFNIALIIIFIEIIVTLIFKNKDELLTILEKNNLIEKRIENKNVSKKVSTFTEKMENVIKDDKVVVENEETFEKDVIKEEVKKDVEKESSISVDFLRAQMMEAVNLEPNQLNLLTFEKLLNQYNSLSFQDKNKIERKYASKIENLYNKALHSKY